MKTFTKLAIAAGIFTASLTAMAFQAGMSDTDVIDEVVSKLSGKDAADAEAVYNVVAEAKRAGVDPKVLATALGLAGVPGLLAEMTLSAQGLNPKDALKPTAAGNPTNAPGNPGITTGPSNAPSWSNAPASTPSGGGGGGVSRS